MQDYFIFIAAGLCRVAALKGLPVNHHGADYIFSGPLGLLGSF